MDPYGVSSKVAAPYPLCNPGAFLARLGRVRSLCLRRFLDIVTCGTVLVFFQYRPLEPGRPGFCPGSLLTWFPEPSPTSPADTQYNALAPRQRQLPFHQRFPTQQVPDL